MQFLKKLIAFSVSVLVGGTLLVVVLALACGTDEEVERQVVAEATAKLEQQKQRRAADPPIGTPAPAEPEQQGQESPAPEPEPMQEQAEGLGPSAEERREEAQRKLKEESDAYIEARQEEFEARRAEREQEQAEMARVLAEAEAEELAELATRPKLELWGEPYELTYEIARYPLVRIFVRNNHESPLVYLEAYLTFYNRGGYRICPDGFCDDWWKWNIYGSDEYVLGDVLWLDWDDNAMFQNAASVEVKLRHAVFEDGAKWWPD